MKKKCLAMLMAGVAMGIVVAVTIPTLLTPIRARKIIDSMESQQGGEYVDQADQLIALGPQTIPTLISKGLTSQKDSVRMVVIGLLNHLAWETQEYNLTKTFSAIAQDDSEAKFVRIEAAMAYFQHKGVAPEGWEPYLDEGHMRFREIKK